MGTYIVSVVSLLLLPARGGRLDELLAGLVVSAVQVPLHDVHCFLRCQKRGYGVGKGYFDSLTGEVYSIQHTTYSIHINIHIHKHAPGY